METMELSTPDRFTPQWQGDIIHRHVLQLFRFELNLLHSMDQLNLLIELYELNIKYNIFINNGFLHL